MLDQGTARFGWANGPSMQQWFPEFPFLRGDLLGRRRLSKTVSYVVSLISRLWQVSAAAPIRTARPHALPAAFRT